MSGQIREQWLIAQLAGRLQAQPAASDLARARLHLLDWTACAAAGAREPAGLIMARHGHPSDMAARAFAWGSLGNILEMDDVDKRAILHPGPSIVPAALALSEGADLGAVLKAIVRGYEATIRLGRAVGPGHYALWHNTGTCGPIGAAAACASLLGLDETRLAHALALGVSQAAGFWQTRHEPGSSGKQLHTAHAARAGLEAARLAEAGLNGPLSILEGPQGFFAATCPGADPGRLLEEYGAGWLIHQVSFKPWPACRHAHAAIDAALIIREQLQGRAGEVEALEIETYRDAALFCDKPEPRTVIEAKFSLQHAAAVAVLRGAPGFDDFEPAAIGDRDLASLRARTIVRLAEPFEGAYPARFGAAVTVRFNDPARAPIRAEAHDAWGDPENPMDAADICAKAHRLLDRAGAPRERADALVDAIMNTPHEASAATLAAQIAEVLT